MLQVFDVGHKKMPQEPFKFIEAYFLELWLLCFGWILVVFTFKYFWQRSKGHFPEDPASTSTVFSESFASGRSLKSWFTRLGGASNCLKVMLTRDRSIIRPLFPFLVLGPELDLVHSIPLTSLESIDKRTGSFRSCIRIRFKLPAGEQREIEIQSKKPGQLENALTAAIQRMK